MHTRSQLLKLKTVGLIIVAFTVGFVKSLYNVLKKLLKIPM